MQRLSLSQAKPVSLRLCLCTASHPAPCSGCPAPVRCGSVPPAHTTCHCLLCTSHAQLVSQLSQPGCPVPRVPGCSSSPLQTPSLLQPAALVPSAPVPQHNPLRPSPASPVLALPWGPDKPQRPTRVGLASPRPAGQAPGRFPGWPQSPEGSGPEVLPCCYVCRCTALTLTLQVPFATQLSHIFPRGLASACGSRKFSACIPVSWLWSIPTIHLSWRPRNDARGAKVSCPGRECPGLDVWKTALCTFPVPPNLSRSVFRASVTPVPAPRCPLPLPPSLVGHQALSLPSPEVRQARVDSLSLHSAVCWP